MMILIFENVNKHVLFADEGFPVSGELHFKVGVIFYASIIPLPVCIGVS